MIVSLHIENCVFFHSDVSLPEGILAYQKRTRRLPCLTMILHRCLRTCCRICGIVLFLMPDKGHMPDVSLAVGGICAGYGCYGNCHQPIETISEKPVLLNRRHLRVHP